MTNLSQRYPQARQSRSRRWGYSTRWLGRQAKSALGNPRIFGCPVSARPKSGSWLAPLVEGRKFEGRKARDFLPGLHRRATRLVLQ